MGSRLVSTWIRRDVMKRWGLHAAARVFHICQTGYDGRVGKAPGGKKVARPDELFVSSDTRVRGSRTLASTVYDVYQVLTWVASRRMNVAEQETWGANALALARALGKQVINGDVETSNQSRIT